MSVEIELSMDINHTDRTTYDFLNFFGDIGGVLEVFTALFGLIAGHFATLKIKAIVTNRFVHLS